MLNLRGIRERRGLYEKTTTTTPKAIKVGRKPGPHRRATRYTLQTILSESMMITKASKQEIAAWQRKYITHPSIPHPLAVVLEVAGEHKKLGEYEYKVICPCHTDTKPSLCLKYDVKTKNVFANCFVCKGTGMSQIDLWSGCLKAWGLTLDDLIEVSPRHEVAAYPYFDKDGNLLYHKVRYEPKDFRYRLPNGHLGLNGQTKTLYALPGLLTDPLTTAYIVEGEKDVDTLTARGRVATTAGGLNDWRSEFNQYFTNRDVVIIADNHPDGRACADNTAAELWPVAASVKVVTLLDKDKGDTTDFFDQGGTEEQFDRITAESPTLTEAPKVVKVKPSKNKQVILERISDMEHKEIHWLWPNRIPSGTYSLLVGNQDVGKSVLSLSMAAVVSTGGSWPDAPDEVVERGSVIIMSTEDDVARTIKPRLLAAGADCSKVVYISSFTEQVKGETETRNLFNLTTDLDVLVDAIDQLGDVRLVIIDPVTAFAGGKKENSNAEVRAYLNPLIALAEEKNLTIVGLNHLNKDETKGATHRTLGSVAWTSAARAVWLVGFDPQNKDDDERRLFLPIKNNLSKVRTGLAFTLVNTQVLINGNQHGHPACKFESGAVEMSADDALDTEGRKRSAKKVDEAVEWLEEFLENGPQMSVDIFEAGKQNSLSKYAITRAKIKLSIKPIQFRELGKIIGWQWALSA
ncbi:hypothetical protein LCGC14_0561440 [marine sediment metagenome]|uniref:AAA+ ATPase domain-containing protein n=1 Tax=marine sediment metagenome TaxID=412755 RepID=A0A0F9S5K7_9ZZZZ